MSSRFTAQHIQHLSRKERDDLLCETLTALDELRCVAGWRLELLPLGVPDTLFKRTFNSLAKVKKQPLPFRERATA